MSHNLRIPKHGYKFILFILIFFQAAFLLSETLQYHCQHFVILHSNHINHQWLEKTATILEQTHNKAQKLFNYSPNRVIPVIIYDKTWQFTRATRQPYYIGAIYDGTIKMQHPQILANRNILKSSLTHEYTHAVLDKLSRGNIPLWLNEGISVYVAGQKPTSSYKKKIRSLKELDQLLTNRKSRAKMTFAYALSRKTVTYIIKQYSWKTILQLLQQLREDSRIEIAVNKVLKMKYHLFEKKILAYINPN